VPLLEFYQVKCRGDYTGEEMYIVDSRSPLSEPDILTRILSDWSFSCRGDYTGEKMLSTLVLPSMKPKTCILTIWRFCAFWGFSFYPWAWWACDICIGVGDPYYVYI